MSAKGRLRNAIDLAAALVMLVAAGSIIWTSFGRQWWQIRKRITPPSETASMADLPVQGSSSARIGIIEFADYQCPYCQSFQRDVMPILKSKYVDPGKIAFAFSQYPIEQIHGLALDASAVAECSRREGRFWPVHEGIFGVIGSTKDIAVLTGVALSTGLSQSSLSACLATGVKGDIRKRTAESVRLGVASTPTFYLGLVEADNQLRVRKVLVGNQTMAAFSAELDVLLARFH